MSKKLPAGTLVGTQAAPRASTARKLVPVGTLPGPQVAAPSGPTARKLLPQGVQLPAVVRPVPNAYEVAWLGILPTTAPALTTDELAKVRSILAAATDQRVKDRAQAVLTANGTP